MAYALVSEGAPVSGAPAAPAFGQATTAGNLLVAMLSVPVGGATGSGGGSFSCSDGTWSLAEADTGQSNSASAIFYKPNCGATETAPTFSYTGGMTVEACLAEFSGGATASPVDQVAANNGAPGLPLTVTLAAPDVAAGELVVIAATIRKSANGTTNTSGSTINNGGALSGVKNNDGTSTQSHFYFAYAITTGNGAADSFTLKEAIGSNAHASAVVVSFELASAAPTNTGAPVVSGTASQGSTLSTTNGTWSGAPTGYSYQWQRDNTGGGVYSNIGGATSSTYLLVAGDVGCDVRCVVTATNAGGSTSANSNALGLVSTTATTPLRVADWRLQIGWSGGISGKLHFSDTDPFFGSTDTFASQWTEYFTGTYDDVTDDVADGSQITWARGSDQDVVAVIQAGESSFELTNALAPYLYDPNDPASPLANGTVSPGFTPMRPVRLIYSLDGGVTWLGAFYHFITEADYDPNTQICTITAQDLCKWLDRFQPVIAEQSGISTSQAIGLILDAVGFKDPGYRVLDAAPALSNITFSADGTQTALALIQGLLDAERGTCWIDGAGVFHFEGRYARDNKRTATHSFSSAVVGLGSKVSVDLIGNTATATSTATGDVMTAADLTSEENYGPSTIADVSSDYLIDDAHANDLAQLLVQWAKDAHPPLVTTIDNPDQGTITDQLSVDVNQRVTILGSDYFVERVDQTLTAGGVKLATQLTVTQARAAFTFLFGVSTFGPSSDGFG